MLRLSLLILSFSQLLCILEHHLQEVKNTRFQKGQYSLHMVPCEMMHMHLVEKDNDIYKKMEELVKVNYEPLYQTLRVPVLHHRRATENYPSQIP